MKEKQPLIRYANCWEDTGILLKALEIRQGETGISIASGGDNTLAMLLGDPERIYAIDRNPAQLWCCELKIAAIRLLEYEDVLRLLGVCGGDRAALYQRVRLLLSDEARQYFDQNPEIIGNGIIHAGKFERFFSVFRRQIIPLFSTNEIFEEFAAMDDPEAQYDFFEKKINNRKLRAMFRIYFGYKVMGQFGRDKSCYDHVGEKKESGSDIRERFIYGIQHTSNLRNPYMQYIVTGGYSPKALPLYLRRRYFDTIRERLDHITLMQSDLCAVRLSGLDFANLSDIFEYMSDDEFSDNTAALAKMMRMNGRVLSWNMQNRRYLDSTAFRSEHEISAALFEQNRSWFYRDVMLYRRTSHEQNR